MHNILIDVQRVEMRRRRSRQSDRDDRDDRDDGDNRDNRDNKLVVAIAIIFAFACVLMFTPQGDKLIAFLTNPSKPPPPDPASNPSNPPSNPSSNPSNPSNSSNPSSNPPRRFAGDRIKHTDFNEITAGRSEYLDRHDVDCGLGGIKRIKLERNPDNGQIRYLYACSKGGELGTTEGSRSTSNRYNDSGRVTALGYHNVDCGVDRALSQFKLIHNPTDQQLRYTFKCSPSTRPLTCRDMSTPLNENGNGDTYFLDRHDIVCEEEEVISQFQLVNVDSTKMKYQYKCCKY